LHHHFTFSPTPQGNVTGALSVTDDAPGSPQSGSLNGASTDEAQRRLYRGLVGREHWMISVFEVFGIDLVFAFTTSSMIPIAGKFLHSPKGATSGSARELQKL